VLGVIDGVKLIVGLILGVGVLVGVFVGVKSGQLVCVGVIVGVFVAVLLGVGVILNLTILIYYGQETKFNITPELSTCIAAQPEPEQYAPVAVSTAIQLLPPLNGVVKPLSSYTIVETAQLGIDL
jgi:hypothetical protein